MFARNKALLKGKRNRRQNRPIGEPTTSLSVLITNRFPLEMIEIIVNFLRGDPHALSVCSRVCKAWLTVCRDHLFGEIILHQRNFNDFFGLLSSPHLNTHVRSRAHGMAMVQDPLIHQRWFQYCIPYMGRFSVTYLFIRGLRTDEWTLQTHPEVSPLEISFQSVTNLELVAPVFQTLAQFVNVICGLGNLEQLSLMEIMFDSETYPLKVLTHRENRFPQKLQELRLRYPFSHHGVVIYHWLKESGPVLAPIHTFSLLIAAEYSSVEMREDFWVTAGHILSKFGLLKHLTIASFGLATTDVLSHNHALLSLRFNNIDLRVGGPAPVRDPHISWQWIPELLDQVISPYVQVVEFEILINDVRELEVLDWERIKRSLSRPQFLHLRSIHFVMSGLKRRAGTKIREKLPEYAERGIVHLSQPPRAGYNKWGVFI